MEILVAGEGHGALAVFHGLRKVDSSFTIAVMTEDQELHELASNQSCPVYSDLDAYYKANTDRLIILSGYKQIIQPTDLQQATFLNAHPSLLPHYRGMHAVVWALLNGEETIGMTLHLVDEHIDHGDIVWQTKTRTENKTAPQILTELLRNLESNILQVVNDYLSQKLIPTAQDHSQASFVGRRRANDCRINWNSSAHDMALFFRALVEPYPLPYFEFNSQEYEVTKAEVVYKDYQEIPGHILYRDEQSVWIKLSDGLLRIFELRDKTTQQTHLATSVFTQVYYRLN